MANDYRRVAGSMNGFGMRNAQMYRWLWIWLMTVSILSVIGLLFIYSSSSAFALERCGSAHFFMKKQLYGLGLGVVCAFAIGWIPLNRIFRWVPLLFIGMLLANCILWLIPSWAVAMHGSARWLSLGICAVQPSEFLKVATVLMLVRIMAAPAFSGASMFQALVPVGSVLVLSAFVLLLQPDFGQALLICAAGMLLFVLSHIQLRPLAYLVVPGVLSALCLVLMAPYRLRRVMTFLNPWSDPNGAGFQVIQSLIAIGSGHVWGRGISASHQKFFYLPMQHTDFIFAIIAEETGLVGCSLLIGLFALLLLSGLMLAWHAQSRVGALLISGIMVVISLQALMNLAVATSLAPTKGIGLPFVSYGLSSLIAHACMVGLVMSAVRSDSVVL